MKKTISILCTLASFALICDVAHVWHNLIMFLLAGIIPGTNIVLPATQMLVLMSILIGLVFIRVAIFPAVRKIYTMSTKQNNTLARKLSRSRA